jgi:hypothetical protein
VRSLAPCSSGLNNSALVAHSRLRGRSMTAGTREPAIRLHSNASFPLPAAQTRAQASPRLERGALRSHRSASLAGPLPTATPPSSTSPTPPRATPPPPGALPAPGRRACCCPGCGSAVVPPSTIRPDLRQPGHEETLAATSPRVDHTTLHAAPAAPALDGPRGALAFARTKMGLCT